MATTITSIKKIQALTGRQLRRVDSCLYIRVTESGSKSWILRWRDRRTKKLRDFGLGKFGTGPDQVSLEAAKELAAQFRATIKEGRDPIAERQTNAMQLMSIPTFSMAAASYIETHSPAWKNPKHVAQWTNTLRTYADPIIGGLLVSQITDQHVLAILKPIWTDKTETATRIRGRIEKIMDWSRVQGFRSGSNPARWNGHMQYLLPSPTAIKKTTHFKSIPYVQMPAFISLLQERDGISALCLEFTILTAARTTESTQARWSEINMDEALWTIPAERMKAGVEHRVPLAPRAIEILEELWGWHKEFIFPGQKEDKPLSDAAMRKTMSSILEGSYTVHGCRASFKTWSLEQTAFPQQVVELAMAHTIKDKVERAYIRSDLLEHREQLITAWASFLLNPDSGAKVINIKTAQKKIAS